MTRKQKVLTFVGGAAVAVVVVGGAGLMGMSNSGETDGTSNSAEADALAVEGITFPGGCFDGENYKDTIVAGELNGSVQVKLKLPDPADIYYNFKEPETVKLAGTKVYVDACATDDNVLDVNGTTVTIDRSKVTPQLAADINGTSIGEYNRNNISKLPITKDEKKWLGETLGKTPSYYTMINNSVTHVANKAVLDKTYRGEVTNTLDTQIKAGIDIDEIKEYATKTDVDPNAMELAFKGEYPAIKVMNDFPADDRAVVDGKTVKVNPGKGDNANKFGPNKEAIKQAKE